MLTSFRRFIRTRSGTGPAETRQDRKYDRVLDARGWDCPLPVMHARRILTTMEKAQVLHVIATDPGSTVDFPALAKQSGSILLESTESDGEFHYVLRKE